MKPILYIYQSANFNLLLTSNNRDKLYYFGDKIYGATSIKDLLYFLFTYSMQKPKSNIIRIINAEVLKKPIKKYSELDALSDWNYFFHNYKQLSFDF